MDQRLLQQFVGLLNSIDEAIIFYEAGKDAPYSAPFLRQVRSELIAMRDGWPSFPFRFGRAIVDWPEVELGRQILAFGQLFDRLRSREGQVG